MKIINMPYGICHLSVVPIRLHPCEEAGMVTQLLFGELLQIIDKQEDWYQILVLYDGSEGWILANQIQLISDKEYRKCLKKKEKYAHRWITKLRVKNANNVFLQIPRGATFSHNHLINTSQSTQKPTEKGIVALALDYLNVPFLAGGRTPFGIDAAGFTQIVYKLNGIKLLRTPEKQASQGILVDFIEETIPGDLAFFDDEEGNIIHVGILLGDNHIIHSYGKVRIDRLDHIGIFNSELRNYTHKLRLMKRIV
ncbi:C40 family peptidase [Capnocytophaga canis]|nr:C40 family peptidase [Capnocytophaga canis]